MKHQNRGMHFTAVDEQLSKFRSYLHDTVEILK